MTTPLPAPPAAHTPPPLPSPPAPLPPDATAGGLAFHRLVFARRRRGWWTPLVTGILGLAFYVAMLMIVVVVMVIATLADPSAGDWLLELDPAAMFDLTNPLLMLLLLGTIALMLPAYVLASLIVNGRRVGLVSSAAGRLRWKWMLLCTAVAAVIGLVLSALTFLIPGEEGSLDGVVAPQDNPMLWWSLAVILLVIPFQAAAEEYVFRGYLMQAVGRWLRHPAFAILLPVPLFVLGHLYDPLGQLSVGIFAVVAGWLTWRTGGLEAAIALHVVNNLTAFLLALFGLSDVNESSPGWFSLIFSLVIVLAFAGAVELLLRRKPLPRTLVLTPPVPPAAPVWAGQPADVTPRPGAPRP
jgi:membrane protease YdiL (CAAX protease family)